MASYEGTAGLNYLNERFSEAFGQGKASGLCIENCSSYMLMLS